MASVIPALSVILCALALILHRGPADAQADLALDCCLKFSHKVIPRNILLSYQIQFKSDGCPSDAVVFVTRKALKLCAPPATDNKWVIDNISFLDQRLKKCKETKFHEKRCHALKNLHI